MDDRHVESWKRLYRTFFGSFFDRGGRCPNHQLQNQSCSDGFWTDDIEVNKNNFAKAQENHSNFIISHIPDNTKAILDVGCGAGGLAAKLLDKGFSVDCVSPSPLLTERALGILGERSTIFRCLFEELESDKLYDTLIFSESFQYIELSTALLQ